MYFCNSVILKFASNFINLISGNVPFLIFDRPIYYMAMSHKDQELKFRLVEMDIDRGLDFPI